MTEVPEDGEDRPSDVDVWGFQKPSYTFSDLKKWLNEQKSYLAADVEEQISTFQSPPTSCRTGQSRAGILRTLKSSASLAELGRTGTEFSRIPAKLEYIFKL